MDTPKAAPSDSSSDQSPSADDLERARAASRRLRGVGSAPSAATRVEPCVRFPSTPTPVPMARPSGPLMTRREWVHAPAAGFGPEAWNTLLEAGCAAVSADAAFLMDPAGLIITSRGGVGEQVEGVGARLMVAFEQSDRIEGKPSTLSLSIETPRGTLFGLRLAQADAGFLTLGFRIPGGLTAERQSRLVALVSNAAAR